MRKTFALTSDFFSTKRKIFTALSLAGLLAVLGGLTIAHFSVPCHGDIPCLAKHNIWMWRHIRANVPLFMSPGQEKQEEGLSAEAVALFTERVAEFDAWRAKEQKAGPLNCAVVANGSTLIDSNYGTLIDSHNVIFRMDNAPMDAYEKDVGTKITFNIIASHTRGVKDYGRDVFTIFWGDNNKGIRATADQLLKKITLQPSADVHIVENPDHQKIFFFSQNFTDYVIKNWWQPKKQYDLEWPSGGFRAIIFALQLCDKVDLFGFGPDAHGKWSHYYRSGGLWQGHRPDYQEEFISTLVKQGIVTRYMGNMNPHEQPPAKKN